MKLGTETASVINHLQSRMVIGAPAPEVGMGATLLGWTDRNATVIAWDGKILTVQADLYTRTDKNGFSECQEYDYTPNPEGVISYFKQNKKGMWREVSKNAETGRWNETGGSGLIIGRREKYWDPSF
jgi:hypothetical protein